MLYMSQLMQKKGQALNHMGPSTWAQIDFSAPGVCYARSSKIPYKRSSTRLQAACSTAPQHKLTLPNGKVQIKMYKPETKWHACPPCFAEDQEEVAQPSDRRAPELCSCSQLCY